MALNFPADTTSPYTDPSSGIKYIFNNSVGAWEAAIQPPCIVSNSQPTTAIDGFFWWDADDEVLYVYQGGAWRPAGGSGGGAGATVTVSSTAPVTPSSGDLWWDSDSGALFLYYTDETPDSYWVPASPSVQGGSGGGVTASDTAPSEAVQGDLWLNTLTNILYVYNAGGWVATQPPSTGVQSVTVNAPLTDSGTADDPVLSITAASASAAGVIEIASQSEVNAGTDTLRAVTPATLATALANNTLDVSSATTDAEGVVELATVAEAEAGTDAVRAVTPAGLSAAIIAAGNANPSGTVIVFAGSTPPTGYLECDGSLVSRATYADLYAVVGDLYGAGDGSTTFQLPDLRGEFVRGWDNGRGIDSARGFATTQNSENKAHTHTITDPGHNHPLDQADDQTENNGGSNFGVDLGSTDDAPGDFPTENATTGITIDSSGGTEARPRNIAMLYCIKF